MDRRTFTKSLAAVSAFPIIKHEKISKPISVKVEVLKHHPETRYETLKEFSTKEEAEEFVRSLMPRLIYVKLFKRYNLIKSGYRGAVRAVWVQTSGTGVDIAQTVYEIIDNRTKEVVIKTEDIDGVCIYECGRAWSIIENIRVDGKPVQMQFWYQKSDSWSPSTFPNLSHSM